jgi:hypothetical protein
MLHLPQKTGVRQATEPSVNKGRKNDRLRMGVGQQAKTQSLVVVDH